MPKEALSLKAFKAKQTLTRRQQDDSRHKMMIQVSTISNRLAKFAQASPEDEDYGKIEMSMAQLKAAEMLLNRTVPVLSSIQLIDAENNENLSREEIEARIKEKIENNPMLGYLAGLTPKVINSEDDPT